jgi:hypothetical protein
MSNFELIDDYLTNRLNELDRKSFEKQMASDPALKAGVELQREIIQGLKAARIAELKAILNKVPIANPTIFFSPLRIAAGLIGTAVLATGLYLYSEKNGNFNPNQISSSLVDSIRQSEQNNSEVQVDSLVNNANDDIKIDRKAENSDTKNNDVHVNENPKESKPAIDLLDPTDDLTENNNDKVLENSAAIVPAITIASIEVSVNSAERKYKSHYQFVNGKLVLYGNFDNGLYEIIEVNGQASRSLFLYYKTIYYLLDESKKEITLLKEISDPVLLQKLNTFQSN